MPLQRREFLELGAAAVPFRTARLGLAQRPNLVLILTDQQSYSAWSGARNPWLSTPAMDSLAAAGTVFDETYCAYPVCSPSRASIFTSRLPHESGVMENGLGIPASIPTMGEIFSGAGYRTAYAGKWHLPKGFDGMTGFEKIAGGSALGAKMDGPAASACVEYLKQAAGRRGPFLLVASFMNPHDVCDWIRAHPGTRGHPQRHEYPPAPSNLAVDPLEPAAIQYHRSAGYDLMSKAVGIASEWRRDDFRLYLHDYYRMVEAVDREIGRVLAELKSQGLAGSTVVALASDHGEGLGGHRWVQKASFYEEAVRVPLMMAGPGILAGRRVQGLATLLDILPTFCDYAGADLPALARGQSLRASLEGQPLERPSVVSELRYENAGREGRMLRTAQHKYIVFNSGPRAEQLFNLELDPGENRNLARDQDLKPVIERHRALLRSEMEKTGDTFQPAA